MMPDMAVHYLNPNVKGFDLHHPAILSMSAAVPRRSSRRWSRSSQRRPKAATARRLVRVVRRRVPLRGRSVHRGRRGELHAHSPDYQCCVLLLAPEARHIARLAVYPNPDGSTTANPLVRPYN